MGLALLRAFLAMSGDGDVGPTLTVPGERPDRAAAGPAPAG